MLFLNTFDVENQFEIETINPIFYRGALLPNETPSTFCRQEIFEKLIDYIKQRTPEKAELAELLLRKLRAQMEKIREYLSAENAQSMWSDFGLHLRYYSECFDGLGIPSIIWERCGIVHYCNPAYLELTQFDLKIPTQYNELAFHKQLSDEGLSNFMDGAFQIMGNSGKNSWQFRTGLRIAGSNRFVQGVLCITIKRDFMELPLIFLGNFLVDM